MAKYLDPSSVGYYGLFTATVGYSLYFVGLDYYTYVTREILKTPIAQRGRLLKDQAVLSGLLYVLFLPVIYSFLWFYSGWPQYLLLWFIPILVLEHFNQEMSRLLISLSQQITASTVLFVRQGSWALAIVALMVLEPSSRQLKVVMAFWSVAGIGAALVAINKLKSLGMGGWRCPLDRKWIKKGIVVSTSFLFATLALRAFQTFDRYLLESFGGIEIVGVYVLFFGVAGSLLNFLDAGVFAFSYPTLIKLNQVQDNVTARKKVRQMFFITLLTSIGFAVISWILLPYLLLWIDNPIYLKSFYLYPWLLSAMIINAISMVPHFALYARGYDKPIIQSHIIAMVCFFFFTWIFGSRFPILAVPISLNFSFATILIWKIVAYRMVLKSDNMSCIAP